MLLRSKKKKKTWKNHGLSATWLQVVHVKMLKDSTVLNSFSVDSILVGPWLVDGLFIGNEFQISACWICINSSNSSPCRWSVFYRFYHHHILQCFVIIVVSFRHDGGVRGDHACNLIWCKLLIDRKLAFLRLLLSVHAIIWSIYIPHIAL